MGSGRGESAPGDILEPARVQKGGPHAMSIGFHEAPTTPTVIYDERFQQEVVVPDLLSALQYRILQVLASQMNTSNETEIFTFAGLARQLGLSRPEAVSAAVSGLKRMRLLLPGPSPAVLVVNPRYFTLDPEAQQDLEAEHPYAAQPDSQSLPEHPAPRRARGHLRLV
jgi:hypothetical protein